MMTPPTIIAALLALNCWTFMVFGFDKLRAEAGHWRIAESTLLGLALIGGSAGAYLGRQVFRHKTRKRSFSVALHRIAFCQGLTIAVIIGLWFG
jgi:uncharacterized membrane protein YsdA (DUF1294 family)